MPTDHPDPFCTPACVTCGVRANLVLLLTDAWLLFQSMSSASMICMRKVQEATLNFRLTRKSTAQSLLERRSVSPVSLEKKCIRLLEDKIKQLEKDLATKKEFTTPSVRIEGK